MAFSYGQLGQLEEANECYLHARQAAKDLSEILCCECDTYEHGFGLTGLQSDHWQALEGLGSTALHRGQVNKAISYYQRALGVLASLDKDESTEQNRIIAKLTYALQLKNAADHPQAVVMSPESRPDSRLLTAPVLVRVQTPQVRCQQLQRICSSTVHITS